MVRFRAGARLLLRFIPLLLILLMLAGCVAPAVTDSIATDPIATDSTANATASESVPAADQTLVLASGRELGPVNPHAYDSSMVMLDLVYEPLVQYAPDGTIQPALAEAWELSADGLTWTFHLRQGVTFHDGTPFDAAAAKWNLERWVANEQHAWLPTSTRITAIDTPDDATLVLTMSEAYYPGMQDLTLIRPVRFLSPNGVDGDGNFVEPIGTGTWQVDELGDARAVLTPYAAYWGEQPRLDRIVVEVVLDPQTRVAALLSGEVDVIGGEYLGGIAPESVPVLERSDEVALLTSDGVTSFYMAAAFNRAPLDDLRLRQAINHAIDREGIVQAIFGNLAAPAVGLMPPSMPYVTHDHADLYTYDPDQARALLAEAGWVAGADGIATKEGERLSLALVVDQSRLPQTASMATAIQAQLQAVGIELKVELMDYSGWLEAFNSKAYDLIMRFTWGPPYDPHTSLAGAFHSGRSDVSYTNAALDPLIDAVLVTTDETERQSLYHQIWEHLDSQAAVIPLIYPQRVYAHRAEVVGFRLAGTEYGLAYAVQQVVMGE